MRYTTIALLLLACGGDGGDAPGSTAPEGSLAAYVPDTSSHYSCVDEPDAPCCKTPSRKQVTCPEGSTLREWIHPRNAELRGFGCVENGREEAGTVAWGGEFVTIDSGNMLGVTLRGQLGYLIGCDIETGKMDYYYLFSDQDPLTACTVFCHEHWCREDFPPCPPGAAEAAAEAFGD